MLRLACRGEVHGRVPGQRRLPWSCLGTVFCPLSEVVSSASGLPVCTVSARASQDALFPRHPLQGSLVQVTAQLTRLWAEHLNSLPPDPFTANGQGTRCPATPPLAPPPPQTCVPCCLCVQEGSSSLGRHTCMDFQGEPSFGKARCLESYLYSKFCSHPMPSCSR